MTKQEVYEKYVKGKSAEEILASGAGIIEGATGEFIRVGAAVRTNQELIAALQRASDDSGRLGKRLALLTAALVLVGILQALATAWPCLAKH